MALNGRVKGAAKIAVAAVMLIFIGAQMQGNMGAVMAFSWNLDPILLSLSFGLFCLHIAALASSWALMMRSSGEKITFRKSVKSWLYSRTGIYIPGKVWTVVGRVYMAGKFGASRAMASVSTAVEIVLVIVTSLMVFAFSLPFWETGREMVVSYMPLMVAIPVGIVLVSPPVLGKVSGAVMRKLGMKETVKVKAALFAKSVPVLFLSWILYGLANYALVCAVSPISTAQIPAFIGMFTLAWTIGFVAFITPGGLGVREGIITLFLSAYFPLSIAAALSLLTRAVNMAAEFLLIALSYKL